jgi:holo-[acyl-carrier protein] synthase
MPGTTFLNSFTPFELVEAKGDGEGAGVDSRSQQPSTSGRYAEHLAGKWAAKEAFIKAWSMALAPEAPPIVRDALDFSEIEVRKDKFGRPFLELHGEVSRLYGFPPPQISISHDHDYATAVCLVSNLI